MASDGNHELLWFSKAKRSQREVLPCHLKPATQMPSEQPHPFGSSAVFRTLNDLTSKFSSRHREICQSAGFGAFADSLPDIALDRNFSCWLISRVNTLSKSISTNKQTTLFFFDEDVSAIFGVPYRGKKVWDASLPKGADTIQLIRESIGALSDSEPASVAAERVLMSPPSVKTKEEEYRFLRAFIIYVMSAFVDSKRAGELEAENYFPALVRMDQVHKHNWAACVIEAVLTACRAAKLDEKKRMTPCPPAGAMLFLQVRSTFNFLKVSFFFSCRKRRNYMCSL